MSSLLVTERYLPHLGGSRRYYHELVKRLRACTVLTCTDVGAREFDRTAGVRIVRRPGIRVDYQPKWYLGSSRLWNMAAFVAPRWIATLFWVLVEVGRRRPRRIHAGGILYPGFAARIVRALLGIPYIVYVHGEDLTSAMRLRSMRRVAIWIMRGAVRIVANSETTACLLELAGIERARIVIARPGVDAERWGKRPGDPRSRLGLDPGIGPVLISVGRLVPHKGFTTVTRALPRLAEAWPGIRYMLVGAGWQRPELEKLAADLAVRERVLFLGAVDPDTLADVYAAADLFVQPNGEWNGVTEGYGIVFLEAGANGLAVIGGRSGGVVEAVADGVTGLLVPPWDVGALVDAVGRLLSDPSLRGRLGEAGQALARERSWDVTLRPAVDLDDRLESEAAKGGHGRG